MRSVRIPVSMKVDSPVIDEPYVLICPCYADDDGSKAVPKQVIRFLNNPLNRAQLKGVIASGNRNFGEMFAYAGKVIARKCGVPCLYKFELSGTPTDVKVVREGIQKLWASLKPQETVKKTGT